MRSLTWICKRQDALEKDFRLLRFIERTPSAVKNMNEICNLDIK